MVQARQRGRIRPLVPQDSSGEQVVSPGVAEFTRHELDPAAASKVRLWDNVDGAWTTARFERDHADHVVNQVENIITLCSHCTFTSLRKEGFAAHLEQLANDAKNHESATVTPIHDGRTAAFVCSVCPPRFSNMRDAQEHIERAKAALADHDGATSRRIRRFSWQPPAQNATPKPEIPAPTPIGVKTNRWW